ETSFSWRVRWLAASRLYLVTRARRDLAELIEAAIAGGVDMVQVREKGMTDRELLPHLEAARALTRKYDVPFVVNDRVDLAGIVGSNVADVVAAGATRIAVVRAITEADDPERAARALKAALG